MHVNVAHKWKQKQNNTTYYKVTALPILLLACRNQPINQRMLKHYSTIVHKLGKPRDQTSCPVVSGNTETPLLWFLEIQKHPGGGFNSESA